MKSEDCPPGLACTWPGLACTWGTRNSVCLATSGVPLGQPCELFDDCEIGTMCIVGEVLPLCEGSSCCGAFCRLDDPLCTTPGTECVSFFEEGVGWNLDDTGICIVPG